MFFDRPTAVSASSTQRTTTTRVPRPHRHPPPPATPTTTTRAPIGHSNMLTPNHIARTSPATPSRPRQPVYPTPAATYHRVHGHPCSALHPIIASQNRPSRGGGACPIRPTEHTNKQNCANIRTQTQPHLWTYLAHNATPHQCHSTAGAPPTLRKHRVTASRRVHAPLAVARRQSSVLPRPRRRLRAAADPRCGCRP